MLSETKLDKLTKTLGRCIIEDLNTQPSDILKNTVVGAEYSMKAAKDELESNPRYAAIKEQLADLSAGLKEVNKRQRAIIQYALHLMEEKGAQ